MNIILKKSYIISAMILCVFMFPAFSIFPLSWPLSIEMMLFSVLVSTGIFHIRRHGLLLSGKSVVALSLEFDFLSVSLKALPGDVEPCNVCSSYVGRQAVVAQLKSLRTGKNYNLLLIRGMCADSEFRRLKKWLLSRKIPHDRQPLVSGAGTSTVSQGVPRAGSG